MSHPRKLNGFQQVRKNSDTSGYNGMYNTYQNENSNFNDSYKEKNNGSNTNLNSTFVSGFGTSGNGNSGNGSRYRRMAASVGDMSRCSSNPPLSTNESINNNNIKNYNTGGSVSTKKIFMKNLNSTDKTDHSSTNYSKNLKSHGGKPGLFSPTNNSITENPAGNLFFGSSNTVNIKPLNNQKNNLWNRRRTNSTTNLSSSATTDAEPLHNPKLFQAELGNMNSITVSISNSNRQA